MLTKILFWRLVALDGVLGLAAAGIARTNPLLVTFFRSGPRREIAEAIPRNDAATVASLAPQVDLNRTGLSDMTLLWIAMRQLRSTPDQQHVLRALVAAGAMGPKGETALFTAAADRN